jgi:uncharacterized protein RhaS with RHS repeats
MGDLKDAPARAHVWFAGELVALAQNGQMYSVYSDHLARPRKVLDATLTTQWDALNRAFDRSVRTNNLAGGLNIGFPGQYQDAESGL